MMVLAFYSPDDRYDPTYIANYTNLYVLGTIKRVPGANQASIFGLPDYAMRIWLRPDRMAQLGISATDDRERDPEPEPAVRRRPHRRSRPRRTGASRRSWSPPADASPSPTQFENIILRAENAGRGDRAREGHRPRRARRADYSIAHAGTGKPATMIAVYQQPGANAIEVAKEVRATLAELKKQFPDGLDYKIALDTRLFTQASIDKVVHTFFEAVVLVVLVVFLFLQSLRSPSSRSSRCRCRSSARSSACTSLGFSINMLTMFGMILAIGLVVDDAIVVVENVERNMVQVRPVAAGGREDARWTRSRAADRDRAGAGRGVPAGRVPRRHHRHAVQAVRDHHRDLGGDLRHHGADAVARARRDHHQGASRREEGLLPVVRRHVRPPHRTATWAASQLDHAAGRSRCSSFAAWSSPASC